MIKWYKNKDERTFAMLGELGFSYVGFIYLLLLFIPNGIWLEYKPTEYEEQVQSENKVLVWLERIGQVCVTFFALIFSNYNIVPFSPWSIWGIVSTVLMLLYEVCWVRYFKSGHTLKDFYRPFLGIPVPLASLPVLAFLLLGIYGKVIWLVIATIILGIGHIGIHLQHRRKITF